MVDIKILLLLTCLQTTVMFSFAQMSEKWGDQHDGIKITGKSVWLKSTWDYNGTNRYFISTDG